MGCGFHLQFPGKTGLSGSQIFPDHPAHDPIRHVFDFFGHRQKEHEWSISIVTFIIT